MTSIWRLEDFVCGDREAFGIGLQRHVAHGPLTTILMAIGAQQRAYLVEAGCAGCRHGRCLPGCRVELLRRLLGKYAPSARLSALGGGLADRPYTHALLAVPGPEAALLTGTLLSGWPEARLLLRWQARAGNVCAAALLLTRGAESPAGRVSDAGWRPLRWPSRLVGVLSKHWSPFIGIWPGRWNRAPYLLAAESPPPEERTGSTPASIEQTTQAIARPGLPGIDAQLADWLHQVISDPEQALRDAPALSLDEPQQTAEDERWPSGPCELTPALLADLLPRLLVEPAFQSGRKGQSGISKGRLAGLRHTAISEAAARALMVWFDQAGILMDPEGNQGPWRAPRQFATQDLDTIAGRLRATPLPSDAAIQRAYGGAA